MEKTSPQKSTHCDHPEESQGSQSKLQNKVYFYVARLNSETTDEPESYELSMTGYDQCATEVLDDKILFELWAKKKEENKVIVTYYKHELANVTHGEIDYVIIKVHRGKLLEVYLPRGITEPEHTMNVRLYAAMTLYDYQVPESAQKRTVFSPLDEAVSFGEFTPMHGLEKVKIVVSRHPVPDSVPEITEILDLDTMSPKDLYELLHRS